MFRACTKVESESNELFNKEFCSANNLLDITNSLIANNTKNEDDKISLKFQTDKHLNENDFDSFLSSSSNVFREYNSENENKKVFDILSISGMEHSTQLYDIILQKNNSNSMEIPYNMSIVGLFCAEGDNRPDGKKLAFLILKSLDQKVEEYSLPHPSSWNVLYGAPLSGDGLSMFY